MASKSFQPPNGTQDSYPIDLARRRWLIEHWRRVSTRHGFEEIDGPTFEHLDVYKTKSGEGIVSELFSFRRAGGKDDYALRPEFTPTLARMYAAKANALPKPTKWFCTGNFFRAERPQRGRRREFWQWNADVIGLDVDPKQMNAEGAEKDAEIATAKARMDAEVIACVVGLMQWVGLKATDVTVRVGSREIVDKIFRSLEVDPSNFAALYDVLDRRPKVPADLSEQAATSLGLDLERFDATVSMCHEVLVEASGDLDLASSQVATAVHFDFTPVQILAAALRELGIQDWITPDFNIARGLAYYTGTVFEVIADGERAVAGGGRYDGLIEMFGGPPTPAVGFGMGDVVLTNLLSDKGLLPSDGELMEWAGQMPLVFVVAANDDTLHRVRPVCARLRALGLHARHSYKATRNLKKLRREAGAAPILLWLESDDQAMIEHTTYLGDSSHEPTLASLDDAVREIVEMFITKDSPINRWLGKRTDPPRVVPETGLH